MKHLKKFEDIYPGYTSDTTGYEKETQEKSNYEKAKEWFSELFKDCEKIDKGDHILYKYTPRNEFIFKQGLKNHNFWIKYEGYWQFLEDEFELNYDEVKELTKEVVDLILNSKEYTTRSDILL